jgi:endonuclease/exonuclease/phosphatase family metal-dependent hydrolase
MTRLRSLLLLLLALATACGGEPSAPDFEPTLGEREDAVTIPSRGFGSTLDVGTWNLEYFGSTSHGPSNENLQLQNARDVIQGTDLDLWGVQEIVSAAQFSTLVSNLPGYAGLLGSDPSVAGGSTYYTAGEQKVALLYKPGIASVLGARVILTSDVTLFAGRPPLEVRLRVSLNGHTEDLVAIVVHMKAMNDLDSWQRRVDASRVLKTYLDTTWPTAKVLVIGDFNDDVDTSITTGKASPYENFVADAADYTFTTKPLSDANLTSVIGYKTVIDHHLASNEAQALYVPGSAEVYRVDAYIPSYDTTTTDHLPVLTRYAWGNTGASVTVTSPNGGESWAGGSASTVTWTASAVPTVALEYTLDDGASWTAMGTAAGSAGSYAWTVPDAATTRARVRVKDVANASIADTTDATFTITSTTAAGRVVLNEMLANEPGTDVGGEFIELVNVGGSAVDLSGWTLSDATGLRHTFASGTSLAAGKALVVFGKAASIPSGVSNAVGASTTGLNLNNGGDTVTLAKPGGGVADAYTYAASLAGQDGVSMNRNPDASATGGFVLHTALSSRAASPGTRANGSAF